MKTIRPLTVKVPISYPWFKLARLDDNGGGCWTQDAQGSSGSE